MRLSANQSWFNIELENGEDLAVYAFDGREEVSLPYEFEVELVSRRPLEQLVPFIGKRALLRLRDKNSPGAAHSERLVHGYVRRMDELHSTGNFTHYRAVIVPRLWFLGRNRNFRIFQHRSVLAIIDEVLQAQGFAPETYEFQCFKPEERYPEREYCVQYGESDLSFISRLCEEEGIYYYFEHYEDGHKAVFRDLPGGEPIPGQSLLRYHQGSGQVAEYTTIQALSLRHSVDTDQASLQAWNFEKPGLNLLRSSEAGQGSGYAMQEAAYPKALSLEDYNYPGPHSLQAAGSRYADLALLRRLSLEKTAEGRSDTPRLTPGFHFELEGHDAAAQMHDGAWWLLSVRHHGEQPQVLQEAAPAGRGLSYMATFRAIPDSTRYLPPLAHPKLLAQGSESAIVSGPENQEIHTDKYGRVRLRFHWDRRTVKNGNSSRWVRVSQGWAGAGYGSLTLPRIGQEVIVDFINGDPDQPIVTGRVYNATQPPPYNPEAHKTRSVFKSMSSPGREGEARGFNELRVEDLTGQEEIYLHAQRNLNAHIGHDLKIQTQNERHLKVDADSYSQIGGTAHLVVKGKRKSAAQSDIHLSITGDSHTGADSWLVEAGDEIHIKAGMKAVLEASTELSLSVGGSFISVSAAGVFVNGAAVHLGGGGAPGQGSGAAPLLPERAKVPEKALPLAETPVEAAIEEAAEPKPDCLQRLATDGGVFCEAG